ncbi:MAG: DUF4349 domain-containing protein [Vicinamibacterales bacterium]|nr:DUF4349 domain-containing protein [Vicinamibacterales bacterium]
MRHDSSTRYLRRMGPGMAVLLALSSLSCQGEGGTSPGGDGPRFSLRNQAAMSEAAAPLAPPPPPGASADSSLGLPSQAPAERKVVRNGSLTIDVPDVGKAMETVRTAATTAGGYVTSETQGRDEYDVRQGTLTCRIPAATLDATVAAFQRLGRLVSVSIQAEDITEAYVDLETRLRNQRQLETRLVALFDRPGNKVTDLLDVEREVARVRSDIESLEGRKRLWDSQVALSTLTVELREPRPAIGADSGGILGTLAQAFRRAGQNVVGTAAWFIAAAGVVVPACLVLWLLWRLVRAVRHRRRPR